MVSITIPSFAAIGAKSRELSQVILRVKSKFLSYLVFLHTQCLIGKFLKSSAAIADHVAMATFFFTQGAFHKSTQGQYLVDQVKSTE
jgi:Na+/H+ antiporter NhaB